MKVLGFVLVFAVVSAVYGADDVLDARAANWSAFRPGLHPGGEPAFSEQPLANGRTLVIMPTHELLPVYLADPRRPQFQHVVLREQSPDIPEVGDRRSIDSAGIQRALLRLREGDDWAVELSGNAGITAQFDFDRSLDGVGFDGWYGVGLSVARGDWGGKFSFAHQSSHIFDEYVLRVGRERMMYTREELGWALSWWGSAHWRLFVEASYAFTMNAELQEPWELQYGFEYIGEPRWMWNTSAWYFAGNFRHMEEWDWELSASVQTGLLFLSTGSQRMRAGVQYYDGQANMGEFSNHHESYYALGLWLDL